MRLCLLFFGLLVTFEMCQIAYRRNRGGRSRPIPRIITNRTEVNNMTNWNSNEDNLGHILETGQSAKSRYKQKSADHNNLISIETRPLDNLMKFSLMNAVC